MIWNDFKSNHKISNQIQIKPRVFQIKSLLFFKSNHYVWFNHDLNQIMIWICPSLPITLCAAVRSAKKTIAETDGAHRPRGWGRSRSIRWKHRGWSQPRRHTVRHRQVRNSGGMTESPSQRMETHHRSAKTQTTTYRPTSMMTMTMMIMLMMMMMTMMKKIFCSAQFT